MSIPDTGRAKFVASITRGAYLVPVWVQDTTVIPRDVPQSLRTFTDTLRLVNPVGSKFPRLHPDLRAADHARSLPDVCRSGGARGWPVYKMVSDHLAERTHRTELVALLEKVP